MTTLLNIIKISYITLTSIPTENEREGEKHDQTKSQKNPQHENKMQAGNCVFKWVHTTTQTLKPCICGGTKVYHGQELCRGFGGAAEMGHGGNHQNMAENKVKFGDG